jgi:hypothetical protein
VKNTGLALILLLVLFSIMFGAHVVMAKAVISSGIKLSPANDI